jgi:hypothetical protein
MRERGAMTTAEFEQLLLELLGQSRVASFMSTTLARQGHDLLVIVYEVEAYRLLPASQQRFHVEIVFPEPNAKEFALAIRRL